MNTTSEKEVWKDVPWFRGFYQVSSLGRIKSFKRHKNGKILKGRKDSKGYLRITLFRKVIKKSFSIHYLVAWAFIPNPEKKPHVNHLNGIKDDNRVLNLEWVTVSENNKHTFVLNPDKNKGSNNSQALLTEKKVKAVKRLLEQGVAVNEISILAGVKPNTIYAIKNGYSWGHVIP